MQRVLNYFLTAIFSFSFINDALCQSDSIRLTIPVADSEYWWMGIVNQGNLMPLQPGYHANLFANLYGNQAQPLLLSNKGNMIWSDEPFVIDVKDQTIALTKTSGKFISHNAGATLKDAFVYASQNFFPPSGITPHKFLFTNPQYNTWIELLYNQNQHDVMKYARGIIDNGFPPGVIMIDDNWQEDYGTWRFHPARFPDPKAMIDSLHTMGFKVMLWTCPFVSGDSEVFRKLQQEELLLKESDGYPKMVRWWNGSSAVLDFTNNAAVQWYQGQLQKLCDQFGVDGFKFDAGDPEYYVDTHGKTEASPNEHSELFSKLGVAFPFNEYRATWKMGGQPLAQRLRDKGHSWDDLKLLIPDILLQGIIGYPFTCPDMIGGGEMGSFVNLKNVEQDLVVRSAQCHALMPMMQFSVAPWRVLDKEHLDAVKQAIQLRAKHIDLITQLAGHAAKTGEPIVRMMAYEFPDQGYEKIADQFMLGNQILVAPILEKSSSRTVVFPKGTWTDARTGKKIKGPKSLTISASLGELPYFVKSEK
jgi:alpha-glucosidase (family GH31 glycosyl hydrolase)